MRVGKFCFPQRRLQFR